ncbi:hypothetical protein IV454_25730 [Massilia antarctica]|uniref:Acetoacetate decarboxylase n=1 Tax=Massilia antarctica TaxID=2765360 RepID=A0AA48WAF1_9BURK|nr:hypothetical protein [Massilia antarctica]QPI48863.1 hypothetical protein IV454_25730 [Massilia antarctica]
MNPKTPPGVDLFISQLGKPLDNIDRAVFSYARQPDFTLPEHSPIGGIFFIKLGFSITFCPPDFYHMSDLLAGHDPIISNVQIYSGDEYYGHVRYTGSLPFGLSFDDGRQAVIGKLGPSAWQFPFVAPFKLERWDMEDTWLLVEYTEDMSAIRMLEIGLKSKKPRPSVLPKILQPEIHTLLATFGKESKAVAAHPGFAGIDLSKVPSIPVPDGRSHEVDALETRGVELYFRASKNSQQAGKNILCGGRYIRKGVTWSAGFDGDLPKGIRFEDTPETVVKKVGSLPVTGKADVLTGYFVWKLPEYLLQVGFSVMEQRVNRIFIAAHPYYAQSLLESPLLAHP